MSENKELRAREVYNDFVNMLIERDWKFEQIDDDLIIKSGLNVRDDGLPVEFFIFVSPQREIVQFISPLPFKISEDARVDLAIAVNVANYGIANGSFDYDIRDGEIRYRLTQSYLDSQLGDDLFEYMIFCGASTVNQYSAKFMALSNGYITVNDFISQENE